MPRSNSRTFAFAGGSGAGALRRGASRPTFRSGDEGAALSPAGAAFSRAAFSSRSRSTSIRLAAESSPKLALFPASRA